MDRYRRDARAVARCFIQAVETYEYDGILLDMDTAMLAGILIEETNRLGITAKSLGPENVNMIARNVKDYGFLQAVVNHWSRIY